MVPWSLEATRFVVNSGIVPRLNVERDIQIRHMVSSHERSSPDELHSLAKRYRKDLLRAEQEQLAEVSLEQVLSE